MEVGDESLALRVGEPSESEYIKQKSVGKKSMTIVDKTRRGMRNQDRVESVDIYYSSGANDCY
jgi:hypothetical protein